MRSSVARDQHLFSCPAEEAIEGRQDAEQPAQWEQGLGYVCNICYGENVPEVDSHVRETLAKDQSCGSGQGLEVRGDDVSPGGSLGGGGQQGLEADKHRQPAGQVHSHRTSLGFEEAEYDLVSQQDR